MIETTEKPKRVFHGRVAGQKRWERTDLWRQTLEIPLEWRAELEAEAELSNEYMSDILREGISRELKRRKRNRARAAAA